MYTQRARFVHTTVQYTRDKTVKMAVDVVIDRQDEMRPSIRFPTMLPSAGVLRLILSAHITVRHVRSHGSARLREDLGASVPSFQHRKDFSAM